MFRWRWTALVSIVTTLFKVLRATYLEEIVRVVYCKISEDIPNVVVLVAQELAQNVDSHYPQSGVRFNLQDSQHCFV